MIKIILLSLIASSLFSDMSQLSGYAQTSYYGFVNIFHSFRWIFALIPFAVIVLTITRGISKLKDERENAMRQEKLRGEEVMSILISTVGSVALVYSIYGIFGMVYADASSFTEVWSKLVFDFWKGII